MKDAHDTATQELIPAAPRKRGRPSTGKAKSGAARQAAYLARKKSETVTVTFNRSDLPDLKILLAQADLSCSLPADVLDRLSMAVFGAAIDQAKIESKKTPSKKK